MVVQPYSFIYVVQPRWCSRGGKTQVVQPRWYNQGGAAEVVKGFDMFSQLK